MGRSKLLVTLRPTRTLGSVRRARGLPPPRVDFGQWISGRAQAAGRILRMPQKMSPPSGDMFALSLVVHSWTLAGSCWAMRRPKLPAYKDIGPLWFCSLGNGAVDPQRTRRYGWRPSGVCTAHRSKQSSLCRREGLLWLKSTHVHTCVPGGMCRCECVWSVCTRVWVWVVFMCAHVCACAHVYVWCMSRVHAFACWGRCHGVVIPAEARSPLPRGSSVSLGRAPGALRRVCAPRCSDLGPLPPHTVWRLTGFGSVLAAEGGRRHLLTRWSRSPSP